MISMYDLGTRKMVVKIKIKLLVIRYLKYTFKLVF